MLTLAIYDYIRFNEILFGRNDVLSAIYAIDIVLSIAFVGFIVCEVTKPINALIASIKKYRLQKEKPILKEITPVKEFNVLFTEYEKLVEEIERYEGELINKTKLATIGTMATMIAHDVRKPLSSIKMFLQILPGVKDNPQQLAKLTCEIEKSINNSSVMLNDILAFSHETPQLHLENHSVQSIIFSSLKEAFHTYPSENVSISYDFNHGKQTLYADGESITRVLTNIITNSLEAQTNKPEEKNNLNLLFKTELIEKNNKLYIKIIIRNNGPEIPADILPRIYEPFFSHGKRNGHGLGLAICNNIVIMHEGELTLKNLEGERGVETTLTLIAGAAEQEKAPAQSSAFFDTCQKLQTYVPSPDQQPSPLIQEEIALELSTTNKSCNRTLNVLAADDEQIITDILRHLLTGELANEKSCAVKEAKNPEIALDLLSRYNFDLIITDIDFGKNYMRGYELAQIIIDKYKNSYVVIHSNKRIKQIEDSITIHSSPKFLGFVEKPIQHNKLKDILKFVRNNIGQDTERENEISFEKSTKKILLLNDDHALNYSTKLNLRRYGVETCVTDNTTDAMDSFIKNKFDLIVSDINLKNNDENGYDFLVKIRAVDKAIPFIMTSGYSTQERKEKAITLGATTYIEMPFNLEKILSYL